MRWHELENDRALQHRVLKRIAHERHGGDFNAAITTVEGVMFQLGRRTPPWQVQANDVLRECGVSWRLDAMQGEVRSLESAAEHAAETEEPDGEQDEHGRYVLSAADAARLRVDESARLEQALEAQARQLPGSADLDGFCEQVRSYALARVDLVKTLLAERRAAEIENEARRLTLDAPAVLRRPRTPFDNALAQLGPFDADAQNAYQLLVEAQRRAERGPRLSAPGLDRRAAIRALNRECEALIRRGDPTVEEVRDLAARAISLGVPITGDLTSLAAEANR